MNTDSYLSPILSNLTQLACRAHPGHTLSEREVAWIRAALKSVAEYGEEILAGNAGVITHDPKALRGLVDEARYALVVLEQD